MHMYEQRRQGPIDNLMRHPSGLCVAVHSPPANTSEYSGGEEQAVKLTPPCPIRVYKVDDYPGCPDAWRSNDPNTVCYFVVVEPGHMIWFDLRPAVQSCLDHYLAAMFSARGNDAFTHQTFEPRLKQFHTCPLHNEIQFSGTNQYCRLCERDWAYQNYIASSSTPEDKFWRDGFCDEKGVTREFTFGDERKVEDRARDVASACRRIDTGDLPLLFDVVIFRSKLPKSRPVRSYGPRGSYGNHEHDVFLGDVKCLETAPTDEEPRMRALESHPRAHNPTVMAGALVKQVLIRDDNPLDFWEKRPGTFRLFFGYADSPAIVQAFSEGKRNGSPLERTGIKVGNPPKK